MSTNNKRDIEDIIPDIKNLTTSGIHATMLSVIQTIQKQLYGDNAPMINNMYWDQINIVQTLDIMADHFLDKLEESYQQNKGFDTLNISEILQGAQDGKRNHP